MLVLEFVCQGDDVMFSGFSIVVGFFYVWIGLNDYSCNIQNLVFSNIIFS